MSKTNEIRDSDAEDKSDATDATDSGTDDEEYYFKDTTDETIGLILNSKAILNEPRRQLMIDNVEKKMRREERILRQRMPWIPR
jgi:hypothetical protein